MNSIMNLAALLFLPGVLSCDQTMKSESTKMADRDDTQVVMNAFVREPATFSNETFKEVSVTKTSGDSLRVTGKARVFEAAFSWRIVRDSTELTKGFEMTDAGAPQFGKFIFEIPVKEDSLQKLTLILFEASAKDGSPQHQLNIPLEQAQ